MSEEPVKSLISSLSANELTLLTTLIAIVASLIVAYLGGRSSKKQIIEQLKHDKDQLLKQFSHDKEQKRSR